MNGLRLYRIGRQRLVGWGDVVKLVDVHVGLTVWLLQFFRAVS